MPGASRTGGGPASKGLRGHGPQRELGEQMAADRHHDARKADSQQDFRDEVGVHHAVQRRQQRGTRRPQDEQDTRQPERREERVALILRRRGPLFERPAHVADHAVGGPDDPDDERAHDVGGRDDVGVRRDARVEHAGGREEHREHQERHRDTQQVGDDDERRQDQLDADAASALALGDAAEDPRAVLRRARREPAVLPCDGFQHPAQLPRQRIVGVHCGASLVRRRCL